MKQAIAVNAAAETENDINLTPMLDVVFIMLIFFVVVASFSNEHGLDLNQSDGTTIPRSPDENILVAIGPDDLVRIDDLVIDPGAIRANIEKLRAENAGAAVIIRADKRSTNKALVHVMDASRQAGVYDFALVSPER